MLHETDLATPPPKPGPFQYLIRLAELNAQLGFLKKG
jgi:hypothetical protein